MLFKNREHAGQLLARKLSPSYKNKNPLVLAIPRGAVPMARIIADALGGELDVVLVHKLGHPAQPELAIGAVDESGHVFLTDYALEIGHEYVDAEKERQLEVIRQRRARYTPSSGPIDPRDRLVIVVDDGIATGSTMTAALRAVRAKKPKKLVAAVGVASAQAARAMKQEADEVVCLHVPEEYDFYAVGQFFKDFSQVSDDDVIAILQKNAQEASAAG
ncbi:MAG TPA: phosphoribosyltransferase family protein [Candidatus Acidoferrales bacterium]|nr:phosphoribosyltransferase family protein [Candidatus Acidoferrales bacterium]